MFRSLEVGPSNHSEGCVDITLPMRNRFCTADRTIVKAQLQRDSRVILVTGLRSSVIEQYERFSTPYGWSYLLCDVPALVTGISLILTQSRAGLTGHSIINEYPTRLVLIFEGTSREDVLRRVAWAMNKWEELTDDLYSSLSIMPIQGDWDLEWHEFLAGESGFVTMDWYEGLSTLARMEALNEFMECTRDMMNSLLTKTQMRSPMVQSVNEWLDSFEPLPVVVGYVRTEKLWNEGAK